MKRYLAIALLFIFSAAGGYYYYTLRQPNFTKDSAAYKAIPASAPFFIEVNSARALNNNNPLISGLVDAGIGSSFIKFVQNADSLISTTPRIPNNLLSSPFILTWGISGRNQMVPLIITKAESDSRVKALEAFLNTIYDPGKYRYAKKDYGRQVIHEIVRNGSEGNIYFSFVDELFLASTRSILIEQVILQMTTQGIAGNPYFQEVNQATATHDLTLYINHSQVGEFFENIISGKSMQQSDEFGSLRRVRPLSEASKFKEFAGWSMLDLQAADKSILFSGISSADDSLNHFLNVFHDQQPVRLRADEVLPANTSFFCSYSFSDRYSFFSRLEDFFMHTSGFYYREERMKRFDRGTGVNLRTLFSELAKNEVTVATGTIPVNPENKNVYFLIQAQSIASAEEQVKKVISNYASRSGQELKEFVSEFSVDNEVRYPVYRFPYPSFPGLWLGNPFTLADARFVTIYNDYVVFANSEPAIHEYLRSMTLGTILSKDGKYVHVLSDRANRSNMNVFVDVNRAYSFKDQLFTDGLLEGIDEREEGIRNFGLINWQVRREKSSYGNSLILSMPGAADEEAQTTWQSVIGSELRMKPQILINHTDPSSRDIIFQDQQNMLHQVTSSGRIRWSIPLPGPVLSDIHQIDYYHNGKYQYLFNTKDKLYLIDRNGNPVAHFPVTLPAPATNGVNVFDYDNNRNYRYFIGAENKRVYAFDRDAEIVKGWNFEQTDHDVTTPVQHFQIEGKDYIVFKDESSLYILNRQGESRVSVPARFENSHNPLVFYEDEKPRLIASDKQGRVHYIYFDGSSEVKKSARFSEDHFFTADDLDGDGNPEFIFADGNELTVMNERGKKLIRRKFSNNIRIRPGIYSFSEDVKKIGVTDAATNRIYLINLDDKLHQGFPLQGNSAFSIGKLNDKSGNLNLIVGSEGGLLFNYTLQ